MSESIGPTAAPPGARWARRERSTSEGLIPADEDGLARLVLKLGHRGQGLRRDDERRGLGPRPARARRLGGRRSPTPARSETSPRLPARPTRSTPGCSPSFAAATWCRRSGFRRSRTARSASAFAAARTWSRRRTSARNRIFGLLTQFGLRISFAPAAPARRDGAARAPRRARGLARLDRRAPRPDRRARAADHPDRPRAGADRALRRASPAAFDDPRGRPADQPHLRRRDRRGLALLVAGEAGRLRGACAADQPVGRALGDRAAIEGRLEDASLGRGRGRQPGLAADQPLPRPLPADRRAPRHQPGEVGGRPQAPDHLLAHALARRGFPTPPATLPRQAPPAFWPPDGPAWN